MSKQHRVRIGRLPRSMTKLPANAWNASLRRKDILLKYELFLFLVTAYTKVTLIIKNVKIDKETKDSSPQTRYDFFFYLHKFNLYRETKKPEKKEKVSLLTYLLLFPYQGIAPCLPSNSSSKKKLIVWVDFEFWNVGHNTLTPKISSACYDQHVHRQRSLWSSFIALTSLKVTKASRYDNIVYT